MQTIEQTEVFDWVAKDLDRTYGTRPIIAMDTTGGGGQAVASMLERLGWTVHWANLAEKVAFDQRLETDEEVLKRIEKDPWASPQPEWVDIDNYRKEVAMQRLAREMYSKRLRLVEDEILWGQFGSTTDHPDAHEKRRVYETEFTIDCEPYDHDLQAFQVWASAIHEDKHDTEKIEAQKLWIQPMPMGWGDEEDTPLQTWGEEFWNVNKGRYESSVSSR
jgi:hypothetical protein